jgi:hypothetical protein
MSWNWLQMAIPWIIYHVVVLATMAVAVMWLWNWLMPDLFNLRSINIYQAGGLLILSTLLLRPLQPNVRAG